MDWLKGKLFGRQLSHGSENEAPATFDEALNPQPPQADVVQQVQMPPMSEVPPELNVYGASPACGNSAPGGKEMAAAYEISKQLVRERLARENPEDLAILDGIKETDIICVRGTYDHIHLVLEAIHIPFAHVSPEAILHMDLKPDQTVYVNCASSFPPEAALKLAKFVEGGGLLITTDWALKHVIEVGFPNTVKYSGNATGDEVVSVEIVNKEDDTLKGFLDQEKDAAPVWWLESSSYPIEVLDKHRVKVLVRSDDLKRRYKHDPVIVRFEWGKGTVYHMISHFYLQRSETRTKKQGTSASSYASAQMVSEETVSKFKEYETKTPGLSYGMVQSAATSSEFVSRCVVKQKKKSLLQ